MKIFATNLVKSARWIGRALVPSLALGWFLAGGEPACAQPKSQPQLPPRLSPAEAERQGRALVNELLSRRPEPGSSSGVLRVRQPDGAERELKAVFTILPTATNWLSSYQVVLDPNTSRATKLTVIHTDNKPNEYLLEDSGSDATHSPAKVLSSAEVMSSFAGSEFWVADLGLEFLQWPRQLLLRKELRKGQSCDVLESTNPSPSKGAYSRVVSWIDIDTGGILHADAYDAQNALLKQFDPTALQKVNGQRQLKEMEIRNRQTGARSWINFDLAPER